MSRPGHAKRCDFYSDTDPAALKVFFDLHRQMSPGQKLGLVFESIDFIRGMIEAGIRQQYPAAGDHEIRMRVASRHLDRDTMMRVYGWDPEAH